LEEQLTEVPGEAAPPPSGQTDELTAVLDTTAAGPMAIRGGAYRLAGYGASALLGVVGVAALTRHLAAADFGRFSVVQSLIAIIAGVAEAGLMNIGIREYAVRRGADRDAMLANLQGIRIALGVAGAVGALAFGVAAGYSAVMLEGIALMGAGIVLLAMQTTLGIPLSASLRWGWVTSLDLLRQGGQVALYLVLVALGAGLLPFYAVGIPVGVGVLIVNVALLRGRAPLVPAFDRARWRALLRMVAPYAVASAVASLYVYAAAVSMSLVASPSQVGFFAASFRVYLVLGGIPVLLVGAAFPILARAARDDRDRLAYATERLLATTLITGVWVALMTAVLARRGIDVIAGHGFGPSVEVLRIQAIAVLAAFLTVTAGHVLISLHRYRDLLVISAAALVTSVALTLGLAGAHGAKAGGIANAAAESVNALAALWCLRRAESRLRYPLGTVPRVLVAGGAAGALALVPGFGDIPQAAAMTVVYGALLLLFRAIPQELLDMLPRRAR
jgi:O-antigen/teichoic acid export membrane protein